MPHAEIIFEDGSHSIVSYADEAELKSFLTENHRRAVNGEPSATQDMTPRTDLDPTDPILNGMTAEARTAQLMQRPSFRAKKVLTYDQHPADLVPVGNEGTMPVSAEAVKTLVDGMAAEGDQINMHQLTQALRDEASPVQTVEQGRFDSQYKMSNGEMDLSFLESE